MNIRHLLLRLLCWLFPSEQPTPEDLRAYALEQARKEMQSHPASKLATLPSGLYPCPEHHIPLLRISLALWECQLCKQHESAPRMQAVSPLPKATIIRPSEQRRPTRPLLQYLNRMKRIEATETQQVPTTRRETS